MYHVTGLGLSGDPTELAGVGASLFLLFLTVIGPKLDYLPFSFEPSLGLHLSWVMRYAVRQTLSRTSRNTLQLIGRFSKTG